MGQNGFFVPHSVDSALMRGAIDQLPHFVISGLNSA